MITARPRKAHGGNSPLGWMSGEDVRAPRVILPMGILTTKELAALGFTPELIAKAKADGSLRSSGQLNTSGRGRNKTTEGRMSYKRTMDLDKIMKLTRRTPEQHRVIYDAVKQEAGDHGVSDEEAARSLAISVKDFRHAEAVVEAKPRLEKIEAGLEQIELSKALEGDEYAVAERNSTDEPGTSFDASVYQEIRDMDDDEAPLPDPPADLGADEVKAPEPTRPPPKAKRPAHWRRDQAPPADAPQGRLEITLIEGDPESVVWAAKELRR